jgi:hypothetical protein
VLSATRSIVKPRSSASTLLTSPRAASISPMRACVAASQRCAAP